ncbi:hypothetical protein B296_00037390, partial [Ensete ventricosum]
SQFSSFHSLISFDQVGCPPQVRLVSGSLPLPVRRGHGLRVLKLASRGRHVRGYLPRRMPGREGILSQRDYYLTVRAGFKVSGAPTNNKGWKVRYFFVSGLSWGFRVDWSIHPISNVPPLLSKEESIMVNRLRGILPLSRAIQDMTEKWLVEVGLSPASRGIPVLYRLLKYKSHRNEGSSRRATRDRELEVSAEDSSSTYHRPKSMKDLCGMRVCEDDKGYYILQMAD